MVETYDELVTELTNLLPEGSFKIDIDCYGAIVIFTDLTTDEDNSLISCEY